MITGFNHSGFVVRDLERMVRFYRDTLGLTVLQETDSIAPPEGDHTGIPGAQRFLVFVGREDATHSLELVYYRNPPSPEGHLARNQLGSAHVAFNVRDLDSYYQRLRAAGVEFVTPPIHRGTPDSGELVICYAQDPEGNWLEFLERR